MTVQAENEGGDKREALQQEEAISEAIRLYDEEGLSYRAAALRLGVVPSTVWRRASGQHESATTAQRHFLKVPEEGVLANYC